MKYQEKSKEELLKKLEDLLLEQNRIKEACDKEPSKCKEQVKELQLANFAIENALLFMNERSWAQHGGNFFKTVAKFLAESLSVDYVFIDRVDKDGEKARTLANYQLGNISPNFEYELKHTPCENIYAKKLCTYAANVQQEFPRDPGLADLNAESYSGVPLWDSNGNAIGLIALVHREPLQNIQRIEVLLQLVASHTGLEIERSEAESLLRESEEKYRTIFENVQDVFYETNLSGEVLEISPSIKFFTEFDRKEIIGKPVCDLYNDPHDREELLDALAKEGELKDYEICLKSKSGMIKYASVNARLIFDENNNPVKINGALRDITERKLAEAELSTSVKRFKQVAESAGEWIWEVDASGLYTYSSPVVEKILGYTPDEIVGKKHFYELFYSENKEEIKNNALRFFALKQPMKKFINQNVHKNGTQVWLSTSGSPILDDYGGLLGYQGVDTDITERMKVEEALKESEFFFKESQKAASIGSYKTDFIGGLWESSEVLDKIFGIETDYDRSIQGWIDIVHPDDREMMNRYLTEEVIGKRKPFEKEYRIVRKNDNQVRWLLGQGDVDIDTDGKVVSLIGTIQDITERKLNEFEIRKLNRAVEATSEVVFVTDKEGIITYVNPAFTAVYGHKADDVIGKVTPRILKSGLLDDSAYMDFWQQLINNRVVIGELINKTKDGRNIHIEGSSNAIVNEGGEIEGFIAIQKDITKRKQIEEELVHAKEKAEESDRLKSAFLANMSHEIRTPMNGILGFAALLKEPNLTSDELQEYTQTIQISGERMLNTINSIIDVSKIESGLIQVDINEANLNERIEFIYRFFKPEAENKGLQFSFKTGLPPGEAVIRTDNEKVYGILTNLIKNALKFTYNGSVEFGYEKKGDNLEFFVKDTGIGIKQNQTEIIFDRFSQASESLNRGFEGSGLGLSICRSYVEMLGGTIWVESSEGKGSIFRFTIPYHVSVEVKKDIGDALPIERKDDQKKELQILIVEDDEVSQILLSSRLKKFSSNILHAVTGREAVKVCKNNPDIDLIFMDIRMPDMDGHEATRLIREFNSGVVIIAQTAFALSGDREKAIASGCNNYISKPINKNELYELIIDYFGENIS
jgi:PAS domain S-box-containing protein